MFCWCGWNSSVAGPIWGLGDVFGALHTSLLLKSIFVSLLGLHVLSVASATIPMNQFIGHKKGPKNSKIDLN